MTNIAFLIKTRILEIGKIVKFNQIVLLAVITRILLKANPYFNRRNVIRDSCRAVVGLFVTGCNKILYDELNLYSAYSIKHIQMRLSHFLMMWVR